MSQQGLEAALCKMREAGVDGSAIGVFSHYYRLLESGETGLIREESIEPLLDPPMLDDIEVSDGEAREAIGAIVMIKLNGGLGTSMGLDRVKNLLEVCDGLNFLDLIVRQVRAARRDWDAPLSLLFMNSFRTDADTLAHLERYSDLPVDDLPPSFLQNQEPKLRADDLTPVEWPKDPSLEWCPPGHGDLYTALWGQNPLQRLIEKGFRYVCISNGDNLGAVPNVRLAGWFASSGAPYAAELCRRTVNDCKGGHLAIRKRDGQLIFRDTAQTAPEEMDHFTDEHRHPFFHTNNLWFDLQRLFDTICERDAVPGLPMIRNEKTVDLADPDSPKVIQVETVMGAAIEVSPGAIAICAGRDRFQPVKTTDELLLLRSDVYDLDENGHLVACSATPGISLDSRYYKTTQKFDARIPQPPSLRGAESLRVEGDWSFELGVKVVGPVDLPDEGTPRVVPAGTVLGA